jgi:hypothetical protein
MDTFKHPTTSRETGLDKPASVKQERSWPWSTRHFDWMDNYCPMPLETSGGNTDRPISVDKSQ